MDTDTDADKPINEHSMHEMRKSKRERNNIESSTSNSPQIKIHNYYSLLFTAGDGDKAETNHTYNQQKP